MQCSDWRWFVFDIWFVLNTTILILISLEIGLVEGVDWMVKDISSRIFLMA
jgi:hypothetical protein